MAATRKRKGRSFVAEGLVFSRFDEVATGGWPADSICETGTDGGMAAPDGKFTEVQPGELAGTGTVVTGSIFPATISPPS